jgi:hypothetical protein
MATAVADTVARVDGDDGAIVGREADGDRTVDDITADAALTVRIASPLSLLPVGPDDADDRPGHGHETKDNYNAV